MTSATSAGLRVEREGAIVCLVLDRPEVANTIDTRLARAMRDVVRGLDDRVRVIILRAEGKVFCGGGDIREVMSGADPAERIGVLAAALHEALLAIQESSAITIAEVDGAVAGGGLGLMLHADLVIASERARFVAAYERIGLTPDCGVSELLPRAIGLSRALRLSVLGEALDAETARDWGLVAEIIPSRSIREHVEQIAARLAASPTRHLARTAQMYREVPRDHAERLDREAEAIAEASRDPFARAAMARLAKVDEG